MFVHLIEARNLHSLNEDGSAQPICSVEMGPTTAKQQHTDVKTNSLNCVWERRFSFEAMWLTQMEFEREKLAIKVYDRAFFTRNQVIGAYECSLDYVYHCKNHEMYRTWVALTRPETPQKEWGYVLLSVYVLKKGDPTPYHDNVLTAIEDKKIHEDLLEAPNIIRKGYLLNAYLYRAQDIPLEDSQSNPFINIRFNGLVTQTGVQYSTRKPHFNSRFQIPYYAPLMSDPIEIQLWNSNYGLPDTFIGSAFFSAANIQIKSIGPLWVNLYSAAYSLSESAFAPGTVYKEGNNNDLPCMYVGRVLLRLSVVPQERNPKLQILSTDPLVLEPPCTMYRLRFSLYSAAEIPVLGGYIQVCVRFGDRLRYSPWVLGKEGKFHWMKQLPSIRVLCPTDPSQVHDAIITLRHRVGMLIEIIGFMRIPAKKLLLGIKGVGVSARHFVINGDQKYQVTDGNKIEPSGPCWRPLRHTNPDDDQKQMIAGFLLFSIGLGPAIMEPFDMKTPSLDEDQDIVVISSDDVIAKKAKLLELEGSVTKDIEMPTKFDPPDKYFRVPCRIVAKIYQAVELPAGTDSGLTHPFAVVRFGGKCALTKTVYDSKCPIWDELLIFDSSYDPNMASPVFINVYHQDLFSRIFLARTELDLKEFATSERNAVIKRYYLTGGTMDKGKSKSFILAQFIVFHNMSTIPPVLSLPDLDTFTITLDCIGLRHLIPFGYSSVAQPRMRFTCPSFSGKNGNLVVVETEVRAAASNCVDLVRGFKPIILNDVILPKTLLSAFCLTVQLFEKGVMGEQCIGVATLQIRDCIDSFLEANSSFQENEDYKKIMNSVDVNDTSDTTEISLPTAFASMPSVETVDQVKHDTKGTEVNQEANSSLIKKTEHETDVDDLAMFTIIEVDSAYNVLVDPDLTNVILKDQYQLIEAKKGGRVQLRKEVDEGRDRKFERELELELKPPTYRDIQFFRGRQAGFTVLEKMLSNDLSAQVEAGVLKAYTSACLSAHKKRSILPSFSALYSKAYIARIYVYRAINLVPLDKWIGTLLDPYLVVRNGSAVSREGYTHMISTRSYESYEDCYNPSIYTCFELDTKLPLENDIEIFVWSKSMAGDELIGSTTIDIERRLLDAEWSDWNRLHQTPREMRDLKNYSSKVSQGKIELRLELVERDWAKIHPPQNIAPPPPIEYELRLILWNTEQIKVGDPKKRVFFLILVFLIRMKR